MDHSVIVAVEGLDAKRVKGAICHPPTFGTGEL